METDRIPGDEGAMPQKRVSMSDAMSRKNLLQMASANSCNTDSGGSVASAAGGSVDSEKRAARTSLHERVEEAAFTYQKLRVRVQLIRNVYIENAGQSQSCMVSKLRILT